MTQTEKNDLLYRLSVIEAVPALLDQLRAKYGTDMELIKATIKGDLIKKEAVSLITSLGVVCLDINGITFLKCFSDYTLVANDGDESTMIELQDMTYEMNKNNGTGQSIYVSDTSYFRYAPIEKTLMVRNFLNNK